AEVLSRLAAPASLCAVVKADAYGHGAPRVAEAALAGGAELLAVALVDEGLALRRAGIAAPVLLLSEPTPDAMEVAVAHELLPTLYRLDGVESARRVARGRPSPVRVEVKLDSGMHRVGASPEEVVGVVSAVEAAPELELAGLWTHLAVADDPDDPFTAEQLRVLERCLSELAERGIAVPVVHAANSAGAIAHREARLDRVRCGIALYGHSPSPALAGWVESDPAAGGRLAPALSWKAEVHLVRRLAAGERTSYGRTYELAHDGDVAVVPLGYHDGVPRRYATAGGEVLVRGKRRRIAGTVTMDQVIVDLGPGDGTPEGRVRPGDEVVLIGRQGDDEITVEEWAERLGTVSYEVLCGIGPRVPRRYVGTGAPEGRSSRGR
nr:alanine racemase [Actinomycetota bacterium]